MQKSYKTALTKKILTTLQDRQTTFCELVDESNGAYPTDVLEVLNCLPDELKVVAKENIYDISRKTGKALNSTIGAIDNTNSTLRTIESLVSVLSSPHPADYDWRFTVDTIESVSLLLCDRFLTNFKVGLFGVTTLYPVLRQVFKFENVHLYNKSETLISDLRHDGYTDGLFVHDLFEPLSTEAKYDVVVADPPWYLDYYEAFIERAADSLVTNGYFLLSVLPELTRPGGDQDRVQIKNICEENGLVEVENLKGFLKYESPTFEVLSLNQSGIFCGDWRRGDLFIYKKINKKDTIKHATTIVNEPVWEEYLVNNKKIKILKQDDDSREFSFENVDATPILSTVSRRSNLRSRINIWTSDNYAFKINKLKVVRHFFSFLQSGSSIELALQRTKEEMGLMDKEFLSLVKLLRVSEIYASKQSS